MYVAECEWKRPTKENVTTVLLCANAVSMLHLKSQRPLCAQVRCGTLCSSVEICCAVTSFLSIVFPQVPWNIFTVKLINLRFTTINIVFFTVVSTNVKGTVLFFLKPCQTQTYMHSCCPHLGSSQARWHTHQTLGCCRLVMIEFCVVSTLKEYCND